MKKLETEIKYQGRTLRQIKREGMAAIYDVRNAGNMLYGYEKKKAFACFNGLVKSQTAPRAAVELNDLGAP